MNSGRFLKWLRVILAILFFLPIVLLFVDFADVLPDNLTRMLDLQIVPAVLGGMVGILLLQLLLALVFGRLYCSTVCPAGVLQDIINRIYCLGKKKRKGLLRFDYRRPMNVLRYGILLLTVGFAVLGFTGLLMLLDPYSNFGRIASNLFRPLVIWGNNLTADLLMRFDNYALYHVTIQTITTASLIAAVIAMALFIVLVVRRGRLFCNTLCPVGALLSLVSRFSLFRITFKESTCVQCGKCAFTCKAEAIDFKRMTVDMSRCVDCFNCVNSCSKNALSYAWHPVLAGVHSKQTEDSKALNQSLVRTNGRRHFLVTTATIAGTMPIVSSLAETADSAEEVKKWPPVTPPGSISLERFKDKCTACQLCVVQCPSRVLRPAGLEYGLDYLLRPHLTYVNSFCNYGCTVCTEVCPTDAINPLTREEKITTQVGIAQFMIERCVVHTDKTDCGACSEHCPTQAVHMVPYEGTLTIPNVTAELCIGCGGCESICPVRPVRAIVVKANNQHVFVEPPKEEEVKEVQIDDFGF